MHSMSRLSIQLVRFRTSCLLPLMLMNLKGTSSGHHSSQAWSVLAPLSQRVCLHGDHWSTRFATEWLLRTPCHDRQRHQRTARTGQEDLAHHFAVSSTASERIPAQSQLTATRTVYTTSLEGARILRLRSKRSHVGTSGRNPSRPSRRFW